MKRTGRFTSAVGIAAAFTVALPAFAGAAHAAERNPYCPSSVQIGRTGYAKMGSTKVASVKQFKGCGKNWGYIYVWKTYRDTHRNWDLFITIAEGRRAPYRLHGTKSRRPSRASELWSAGTNTLRVCTHAAGIVGSSTVGRSSIRC